MKKEREERGSYLCQQIHPVVWWKTKTDRKHCHQRCLSHLGQQRI